MQGKVVSGLLLDIVGKTPCLRPLAKVPIFDNKLYWVVYKDNEPAEHVREHLLVDGKYAFYVKGFDADDFFVTLAQRLNSFPPDFISKPFSHLDSLLETITPYTLPGQTAQVDVTDEARKLIRTAIGAYGNVQNAQSLAQTYLMQGNYDAVIALLPKNAKDLTPELLELASWAYIMQGNSLFEQATTKTGEEADRLFALAGEKYQAALKIKPDKHEALNSWGVALYGQAKTKTGEEADCLLAQSKDLLLKAESILPGSAAYNIACWSAIRGQEDECKKWLEKSLDLGVMPSRQHLEKDQDLEKVRERPWFKAILARL